MLVLDEAIGHAGARQTFGRGDVRQFRIAPISHEMARNILAESVGLPRSF